MPSYTVEAVQRQDRMRPDGGTKQIYLVWLTTEKGASGRVEISADVWESSDLDQRLKEEVAKLDKVFTLAG